MTGSEPGTSSCISGGPGGEYLFESFPLTIGMTLSEFRRRRSSIKIYTAAAIAIEPRATPVPMPAFAPVLRPAFSWLMGTGPVAVGSSVRVTTTVAIVGTELSDADVDVAVVNVV